MKAIALNKDLTARETNVADKILLFVPSMQMGDETIMPASEIYLAREEIAELAREFPIKALRQED